MTDTSAQSAAPKAAGPLRQLLSVRLAAAALIGVAVLGLAIAWLFVTQHERATRRWLAEAAAHFEARTRRIDAEWVRQAELLRSQIDFSGALDGSDERLANARVTAMLASMGGQGNFTHHVLLDGNGHTVFSYGTRTQSGLAPASAQPLSWVFSPQDRLMYRALRAPLRLGARGAGELVLFAPVDNALLAANAFPETTISLHWRDHDDIATSFLGPGSHPMQPTTAYREEGSVAWSGESGAPELHFARTVSPAPPLSELLAVVTAGVAVGSALVWLVLGRWAGDHVRRISALSEATTQFTRERDNDPAMVSRIDQAIDGTSMELHTLGLGLKTLMGDVKAASAAERAAQKRQLDLNASLEQRVQERTVELAAARDEALAASRAKEQFLAGMSHELRTPLAGLLGGLEMIEDGLLPPAQQRLLQVSRRSGDALRSVINEVLDYSKLESGRVDLARQPFHPDDVAREAVSLFAAVAARKGLSLTCHCEAGCERPVMGDPARLRQVLLNLIGNALKFTDSGRVDLRLSRLQSPDDRTARLRFAVQDTGIGIDAALQEQLFKPFVQADTTQREARGGSGLGLAISQRLVSAMGGQIGVRSEPGQGSVFAFELDLQFTQDTVPESPSAKDWPTLRGRVLLVEDNAVNRIVAVTMLHRLGLEVDECENGLEAVAALRDTRFDLVLMDSQMPVLDGLSATRRIRGGEAGSASAGVPILAVTANAMDGDAQRCVAAGMNGHLSKPFSIAELARAVAPWLTTR